MLDNEILVKAANPEDVSIEFFFWSTSLTEHVHQYRYISVLSKLWIKFYICLQIEKQQENEAEKVTDKISNAFIEEQAKVNEEQALKKQQQKELETLGIDSTSLETLDLTNLNDNSGLVPGFISSMRNS